MDQQTIDHIKEWVRLDDKHRELKSNIKVINDRKVSLEKHIKTYVKDNRLTDAQINVNDGALRFTDKKTLVGLSLKFLKEQLSNFFADVASLSRTPSADTIYTYIAGNRKEVRSFEMIREITATATASTDDDDTN
jgi:hypothetical protein